MRVRFLRDSRHGDWKKGDLGETVRQVAWRPLSQADIYIVKITKKKVWATHEDFEEFNQLCLF